MKFFHRLVFLLAAAPLSAAEPPEEFKKALRRALDADARWTMVKTAVGSPVKIKLEGVVSCSKGEGIVWRGDKPFRTRISLLKDMMILSGRGGERILLAGDMPHYAGVREAIDDFVFDGESRLGELFSVLSSVDGGKWKVELTPKRSDMKAVVESVTVWGGETVDKALFSYASGERALFEFKETGRGGRSLWKEDR